MHNTENEQDRPDSDHEETDVLVKGEPGKRNSFIARGKASRWLARMLEAFWNSGLFCVLLSSTMFSISSALVKIMGPSVPVMEIILVRSILSMGAGVGMGRMRGISPLFGERKSWPLLAARGTCGSASILCRYMALTKLPLADSVSIFFVAPAITAILALVILGERAGPHTVVGCAASLVGVAVVAQPPMLFGAWTGEAVPWTRDRIVGVAFALGGALMGSISAITIRRIGMRERPLTTTMWFHFSSYLSAAVLLLLALPAPPVWPAWGAMGAMIGVAATSFLAQLCSARALQLMRAAQVGSVNLLQVVWANLMGAVFFHEPTTLIKISGGGLIAIGIVEVSRDKEKAADTVVGPEEATPPGRLPQVGEHAIVSSVEMERLRAPGQQQN